MSPVQKLRLVWNSVIGYYGMSCPTVRLIKLVRKLSLDELHQFFELPYEVEDIVFL